MPDVLSRPYVSVAHILHAIMRIAAEHHRVGRAAAARTMYLQVLRLDPRHSDALFFLGVLERQAGRLEEARRRLSEAARWAADRAPIEAELRALEQLAHRRNCKPAQAYRQTDCSALPMMGHA